MAVSESHQPLTTSISQDSDEDMPICSTCKDEGNSIEAYGFCSNCKEYLCEACYNFHLRPRLFRNHVLLDKSTMPRKFPPPDYMCKMHPEQQLEYYCTDHKSLECGTCVRIDHRKCDDVSYIPDIPDGIEESNEFKTLLRTLTGIEHNVIQNEAKVERNLTDIQTNVNETKESIRSFRKYLNQQLDKMENALCKEVDKIGNKHRSAIKNVSGDVNALAFNVRTEIDNLTVSRKTRQKMHMFIIMKNTQGKLTGWQNQLHDIASKNKIQRPKFEPEKQLQSMIGEDKTLGCLLVEDDAVKPPDPGVVKQVQAIVEGQAKRKMFDFKRPSQSPSKGTETLYERQLKTAQNITMTRDDRVSVKSQSDSKRCQITGSQRTDDNTLAIADYKNTSIKLIDLNKKKVKGHLALKDSPWAITRINEHTLAITCPSGPYIQLVGISKSGSLTLDKQINVHGQCYGIRYIDTRGGVLVVSFVNPHEVKVMDMSGSILTDFSSDSAGQPRFDWPYHITFSNADDTLIVSNELKGLVTGLTLNGEMKFEYWNIDLSHPTGVTVGDGGEIYVCDWMSNSIHMISSEGKQVKVLLKTKGGVPYLHSVSFSNSKLFVGGDDDYVDVYNIRIQRQ